MNEHGSLVIVGSGPIGMVSALLMKDRFQKVTVLERQSREHFLTTSGFTFPIVFSPAAIRVLERVGAWTAISEQRSRFFGVVVHKRLLGRHFTWTAKQDGVYSHWRHHIIAGLHDRLAAEGIDVRFDAKVERVDFAGGICTERTVGDLPFDLLIGADGIHSQTRELMAATHPTFDASEFSTRLLDRWHAFRLPAGGALADRFGGGPRGFASHVFVDDPPGRPTERFRVITTAMEQPRDEICVVVKYGVDVGLERARELNRAFFDSFVDGAVLEEAWEAGAGGTYDHVRVPTFHLDRAVLVGDAAHGFESTGDLINVGLASLGSLVDSLDRHADIGEALEAYDATTGSSLRAYSEYALRRSLEKIAFEVAAFELGALIRLNDHHPSMWGIFEDDFDIDSYMAGYERHRRRLRFLATAASAGGLLTAGLTRRVSRRRSGAPGV